MPRMAEYRAQQVARLLGFCDGGEVARRRFGLLLTVQYPPAFILRSAASIDQQVHA